MSTSRANSQKLLAGVAVVVIVLLAIVAFLLYNKIQQDKENVVLKTELTESEKLEEELQSQFHEALSELEELKGTNDEMDALITQQKAELGDARVRIEKLIREGRSLDRARSEVKNLKLQIEQNMVDMDALRSENSALKEERSRLVRKSENLEDELDGQRAANTELEGEKMRLSDEKSNLEQEKSKLSKTVKQASVVDVSNIKVTGIKFKSNGKAVEKKHAKNIDQLNVCFETTINDIARAGLEKFYVRIVSPIGETLSVDELGSGKAVNERTGEEFLYTKIKEYEYTNDKTNLCLDWKPSVPFQNGKYQVEVYNKGYLSGEGSFLLK